MAAALPGSGYTYVRRNKRLNERTAPLRPHAYHQTACGATPRRHRRHDAIAKIIGDTAASNLRAHSTMDRRLSSSTGQHSTKVDLVITAYDRSPSVTAIDVTISCPLLPSHSPAAAISAARLFDSRALEKNNKHLAGSIAQRRRGLLSHFLLALNRGVVRAVDRSRSTGGGGPGLRRQPASATAVACSQVDGCCRLPAAGPLVGRHGVNSGPPEADVVVLQDCFGLPGGGRDAAGSC